MPSSLTANLPIACVLYTRPPVSVCGTGAATLLLSGFSWELGYAHMDSPGGSSYYKVRLRRWICLPPSTPTPVTRDFRHPGGLSLLRPRFARRASAGILTGSSIRLAIRLSVRSRLTLIRLALIRNPWPFGGGASHPPYRYSFLHLLFRTLQSSSRTAFAASGMLPYRLLLVPRLRRAPSCPIIIHARPLDW